MSVLKHPPGVKSHTVIDSTGLKVFGEGEWKVKNTAKNTADGAYDTLLCHDELRRKKISALIPP